MQPPPRLAIAALTGLLRADQSPFAPIPNLQTEVVHDGEGAPALGIEFATRRLHNVSRSKITAGAAWKSSVTVMTNELLTAATQLLEARAVMQLTEDEWEALAQAVKDETGQYIQWRIDDELNTE